MTLIKNISLIFGLVLLLTQTSVAAVLAGHVILTKGSVIAASQDGDNRTLKRRSQIFNGDVIKTGPAGSIQIRFVDKALMTIKANSEMNIERYLTSQQKEGQEQAQVIMSLVKGGFRTITGSIGKGDKDAYKVNTPAASIGIRGTNYEVQQESDGSFVMGVYSGGIQVENESGAITLGEGADFNFTRVKPKSSPKGLLAPPPTLGENTATEQTEEESEQVASEDATDESAEDDSNDDNSTDSEQQVADNGEEQEDNTSNAAIPNIDNTVAGNDNDASSAIDDKLASTIEDTVQKVDEEIKKNTALFDFNDPYKGVTVADSTNPFDASIITDQQFELAESGKLAMIAMPANSSLSNREAVLISPEIATVSGHDFIAENANFTLSFKAYNLTDKKIVSYEIDFKVDAVTSGNGGLIGFMTPNSNTQYRIDGEEFIGVPPDIIDISFNSVEGKYEFRSSSASSNRFILEMELNFQDENAPATLALQQELGSSAATDNDDWRSEINLDMAIGNGSWDSINNRPILVMRDQNTNDDGTNSNLGEEIEVVTKPLATTPPISTVTELMDCMSGQPFCDIQVDTVKAGNNIRWGAWFTAPGEGIQINRFNNDGTITEFENKQEEDILAFWVAAERADLNNINPLTGSASFSGSSNCTDFEQCIGISDDGLVQSLTGGFDVNLTSGAITNGNLTLETTQDLGAGGQGSVASTWDVNFSGQLSSDGTNHLPEFQTENINGTVTHGGSTSTDVIGNIGGVFVKPGDAFAGGYSLGTVDGTDKQVSGVFSLKKEN